MSWLFDERFLIGFTVVSGTLLVIGWIVGITISAPPDPVAGEYWCSIEAPDDPFPPREGDRVYILEVRQGWVRYALLPEIAPPIERRGPIATFTPARRRCANQEGTHP